MWDSYKYRHSEGFCPKNPENKGKRIAGYIYILASRRNGTLYVGVTSDLIKRVYEHKSGLYDGFTKKYNVKILVYYEIFDDITYAIKREKILKG